MEAERGEATLGTEEGAVDTVATVDDDVLDSSDDPLPNAAGEAMRLGAAAAEADVMEGEGSRGLGKFRVPGGGDLADDG